jgi:hypothetical protein
MLVTDEKGSIFHIDRDEPLRRRNLYTRVLDLVQDIERRHHAVALAGTYVGTSTHPDLPAPAVALIAFFSKQTDPGAVKRKTLLVPDKIDMNDVWRNFCNTLD